ncbi:MAG: DUF4249 domain-containing protein [Bacteroidetes bacterium]|nr:DUF4249 domain-containing protein [Bacteroidota bacterium]
MTRAINIVLLLLIMMLSSCEEVITIELTVSDPQVVVEGSIENGAPPLVILSRSFPFFGDININDISALLLDGAYVTVTNGVREVELMEYNTDNLAALDPSDFEMIVPIIEQYLGFEISQDILAFIPDITFYTVAPTDVDFLGEIGHSYDLSIQLTDHEIFGTTELSASTFIPFPVHLDSLWMEDHPNSEIDTLFQMRTRLKDPDTSGNYYRIFTRVDGGPWLTTDGSVFDDAFFDGQSIPFTVTKGQTEREKLEDGDFDVDGYWSAGELADVKLSMITQDHYQFWRTVENEKGNLGNPFGSFTVLASNVQGGVGIWGGYSSTIISILVTEP